MDTEFYLAGALAFLLAMLGWSDQIRGTQEKTRLLEKELLTKYKFSWDVLQPLIRPDHKDGPKQRLTAVMRLLGAGGLTYGDDVLLLKEIENANQTRVHMEARYSVRFWLVFATAAEMFVAGIASVYFRGKVSISLFPDSVYFWRATDWQTHTFNFLWRDVWISVWLVLIAALLYQTMRLNFEEQRLRHSISKVDDLLRQSREQQQVAPKNKSIKNRFRRRQPTRGSA